MSSQAVSQQIEAWPVERLVEYPRNPRKNDGAVDRMCGSIREFGFKIPCLVRSDGEVVDGHLRLKAARKLGITEIPVILCDEWAPAQVKAFRLMVNRSVTWADWDEDLLALELQEIQEADFDLSLTGFDPGEIDKLLVLDDEEKANATPPLPESPVSRLGDLWLLGTAPRALWRRDQRGSGRHSARRAQAAADGDRSSLRHRTGFRVARSSRAEWPRARGAVVHEKAHRRASRNKHLGRYARGLVRCLRPGAQPRGRLCLARLKVHARSTRRAAAYRLPSSPADHLEQRQDRADSHALLVSARAVLVREKEERTLVR